MKKATNMITAMIMNVLNMALASSSNDDISVYNSLNILT